MTTEPKIYVACLAAYNNAYLHGKWIDLTQELEDVWTEINTMLKSSPIPEAEEYAIHGATRSRIQRAGILPPSNLLGGSQPRSACRVIGRF